MESTWRKCKSYGKLSFAVSCYGFAFYNLTKFGFWCEKVKHAYPGWTAWELIETGRWTEAWNFTWRPLLQDLALLVLFALQHSMMAQSRVVGSKYWEYFHILWKIDKPIYNACTGLVIHILLRYWEPVNILIWNFEIPPQLELWYKFVHFCAWIAMFGLNTMIDLPNLSGVDQVIINHPTNVPKSPEYKNMIGAQRHLGLVPLTAILLIHPCMSLDRLMLLVANYIYIYMLCSSKSCFKYASNMKSAKLSVNSYKPKNLSQSFG